MMGKQSADVLAFIGDEENTLDACRFLICSISSKVLVVDLSEHRDLFTDTLGKTNCKYVSYREVVYTCDGNYALSNIEKYDTLVVYTDTVNGREKMLGRADYTIYCYGPSKKSFYNICQKIDESCHFSKRSNTIDVLLYRGNFYDDSPNIITHMIGNNTVNYTVPFCEENVNAKIKVDYGYFDIASISRPMRDFLAFFEGLYGVKCYDRLMTV